MHVNKYFVVVHGKYGARINHVSLLGMCMSLSNGINRFSVLMKHTLTHT